MSLSATRRCAAGLACALVLVCAGASAETAVGSLAAARGTIVIQRSGQPPRVVERGAALAAGDTINVPTGGLALVVFADDTRIVLRPGTVFRIEAFAADGTGTALFELVRGGLRALTGAIAKRNPRAVRFRTSSATIGIRGTAFDARLCGADCAAENKSLGASGEATPGLYAKVRTGGITLERNGVLLDVPAGRAARAAPNGLALLDSTPPFLEQDPTPLPESDDAFMTAGAPAPGADGFYRECTVDGAPVFGANAAQVAASGGESRATFAATTGTTLASAPAAVARLDTGAQIRAGAVPAAANVAGMGGGGPPPGTRLNANPGRPPGSNLNPGGGGAGAPREYTGNVKREAPAQLSERAQRYRNEQENAADIVYREQDAVRDHAQATTGKVLDDLSREGNDAYAAEFEIARAEGASKLDAARRASAAIERTRRAVVDQALLDQLVANGTVDAGSVSGTDPTTALKFGLGLELGAQRAGLKGGKDLAQSLSEDEMDALRERLRKNPQDVEGAVNEVTRGGFVREFGMAPEEMMQNMRTEAVGAGGQPESGTPGGGATPGGGSGTDTSKGTPSGSGSSVSGGANSDTRGNPGRSDSGSKNERPAGNQSSPGTASGTTSPGSGGAAADATPGGTGGGGITPSSGGSAERAYNVTATNVTHNEDGSTTIDVTITGPDGASEQRVITVERDGSANVEDVNGELIASYEPGTNQVDGVTAGATWGSDSGSNIVLTDEDRTDGSGGDGGGNDQQDNDGSDTGDDSNDTQDDTDDSGDGDTANECTGESCTDDADAGTSEDADAPAESTDEGGGGRPNPMADDPVNTAMEIYLDVMVNGGRGTRQQMRAIEVAAGGGVTDPGDDPNATGAGGSTSFNLDIKNIVVKGGGGVDGTRAEQDPVSFNALDMDLINLRSGGAVTDPPRESEGGGGAPVVVGAGGVPGEVGPVPALREGERALAPNALGAAIEASTQLRNSGAR